MSTRRMRLTAFVLASALLAGACSSGGDASDEEAAEDPKQALTEALDAFAEYEGITLEMTIEADPEDLVEDDTPPEVAEAIVNSSLVVSAKGETPEETQAEIRVNVDGNEDAFEMRFADMSLYARVEVRELVEAFDGDTAMIDQSVEQASAMGFDFAQALADGEWVGMEGLDEFADQLGLPVTTPDPEQAAALQEKLAGILERNAEVTSEGTDDVGAHLRVTLPLKQTTGELLEALSSVGGAPPGTFPTDALNDLPTADIPLDVWISDGRLVQVEFDVLAIGEALGEETEEGIDDFAIRLAIDEFTEEVEAPEDFVPIDLQQMFQGVFGAGLGGAASGGSTITPPDAGDREVVVPELGLACSDLAGVPPDQIKAFLDASGQPGAFKTVKQACPELF